MVSVRQAAVNTVKNILNWSIREELAGKNGVIIKGNRVVIPTTMKNNMLKALYYGHLGLRKPICEPRTQYIGQTSGKM